MLATLAFAPSSDAALGPTAIERCLASSNSTSLAIKKVTADLGLTVDQLRVLNVRLASWNSVRGFEGFDGIGLTSEQITEMQRRIDLQVAAMNRYPLGYPCKPFKQRTKTVAYVRQLLVDNGFRKASIRITAAYARQFQFTGIQDGYQYFGVVARTAPQQITIRMTAPRGSGATGGTYRFQTAFEP